MDVRPFWGIENNVIQFDTRQRTLAVYDIYAVMSVLELIELIKEKAPLERLSKIVSQNAESVSERGKMGLTPLHYSVHMNNIEHVRFFLEQNSCDINSKDSCGYTPLHLAAQSGYEEVASELMDHGADVNSVDDIGFPPLHWALAQGRTKCVEILLKHGADQNKHYETAGFNFGYEIHNVKSDQADCLEALLKSGVHTEVFDSKGLAPLHMACLEANILFVNVLLRYGADPNVETCPPLTKKHTPLRYAVISGERGIAELLLMHGADPNVSDYQGSTALHISAAQGFFDLVQLLLCYNADIRCQTKLGIQPLHRACQSCVDSNMILLLLQNGADSNVVSENGETPLLKLFQKYQWASPDKISLYDEEFKEKILILVNYGAKIKINSHIDDPYNILGHLHSIENLKCSRDTLIEIGQVGIFNPESCPVQSLCKDTWQKILSVASTVSSLRHLCRLSIRHHLIGRCFSGIQLLPLPQFLKQYLLFKS